MIIRRQPEDFRVEEVLNDEFHALVMPQPPSACAGEAIYRLTKTSLATPEAVSQCAAALKVKPGVIGYGGLKDKHAVTSQYVSVPRDSAMLKAGAPPASLAGRGWSAEWVGWSPRSIDATCLRGNRFVIVLREIQQSELRTLESRASALQVPQSTERALMIANYFGDQRFGSARHGEGFAAAHLARGDFEAALKLLIATPARKDTGARRIFTRNAIQRWGNWTELQRSLPRLPERLAIEVLARGGSFRDAFAALPNFLQVLAVEAFQSHLWNATVRRLIEILGTGASKDPVLRAADDYGELIFPRAAIVPEVWLKMSIPMPSSTLRVVEPWGEAMRQAVSDEGLTIQQLVIPGLRRPAFGAAERPLFVTASDFRLGDAAPDELSRAKPKRFRRTVEFALPRGAYATIVLRAIGQ